MDHQCIEDTKLADKSVFHGFRVVFTFCLPSFEKQHAH